MGKTLEPLGDRVLVEVLALDEMTAGGVHLPDAARERSQRGLVLAVGQGRWSDDGCTLIPPWIHEGEVVVFSKYGGTELPDGNTGRDKQLLILREADVLGIERDQPVEEAAAE